MSNDTDPMDEPWFRPNDKLGGYSVKEVMSAGYFSYNLHVVDGAGLDYHAVVPHRTDLNADTTYDGVRLEAKLQHPGLPRVVYAGNGIKQTRGNNWFVREMLPAPLGEKVDKSGPLSASEILEVGLGVCELFEYLHNSKSYDDHPLVHGFLKPGYIHRQEDGAVKVAGMDVQVLVAHGVPTPLSHLMYRAPECIDSAPSELTTQNDLWAIAACMYFLATGKPPCSEDARNIEQLRRDHDNETFNTRAKALSDPALRQILVQCSMRDLNDRYVTASELRLAIREAISQLHSPAAEDKAFSSQTIVVSYPTPIAIAYRRFCRQDDPTARLTMLFLSLEATLRYLFTLGVSDLFQCASNEGRQATALPEHAAFDFLRLPQKKQLTLGTWVEALRETARALSDRPDSMIKELSDKCGPKSVFLGQIVEWLVTKRNDCCHEDGSIAITPDECRETIGEARPKLEEALHEIQFICRYPLGFLRRTPTFKHIEGQVNYQAHSCMGSRVADTRDSSVVQLPAELEQDVPFVVIPERSRLLYLWPLLLQRVAVHSGQHTLYVFEEIPNKQRGYLTEIRSAAIDFRDSWKQKLSESRAASHDWIIERFQQRPPAPRIPREPDLAKKLQPKRGGKLVGRRLDGGRLTLTARVAEGGFGVIYEAKTKEGSQVAVKVIESRELINHNSRFYQEFRRLKQAKRFPGIIRCFEAGEEKIGDQLFPWYSMEFAVGGDLNGRMEDRLTENAHCPIWQEPSLRNRILNEFRQVVAAVAHLHEQGIVHRDIKPGNVLILEDGSLRLSDFGLAKRMIPSKESLQAPVTSTGAVMGTPRYMAPEQLQGKAVEESADVYALGILLAELTTGRQPTTETHVKEGATTKDWLQLISLPKPLATLIRSCTNVCAEKRPRNAGELLAKFERIAKKLVVTGANRDDAIVSLGSTQTKIISLLAESTYGFRELRRLLKSRHYSDTRPQTVKEQLRELVTKGLVIITAHEKYQLTARGRRHLEEE